MGNPRACVFLADGFEEIEVVTIVDVLRRAGVEVSVAAVGPGDDLWRRGAHDIAVRAELRVSDVQVARYQAFVVPGGQPGASHLRDDARVQALLREAAGAGCVVAAICAGPIALESAGLLRGRSATSYPGVQLETARVREERVVVDGAVITSRGPGTALEFSLALVGRLVSEDAARALADKMLVQGPPR